MPSHDRSQKESGLDLASTSEVGRPPTALSVTSASGAIDPRGAGTTASMPEGLNLAYARIDQTAIELARHWFAPIARASIFVIYSWFGLLKVLNLSPATPLAAALTAHTIGLQYFSMSFRALGAYEFAVGVLFLRPAATRIAIVLLIIHMGIVCSPLVLVADHAWASPLVPTFEGQYIIKDLAVIALAVGILAKARPLAGGHALDRVAQKPGRD